MSLERVTMSFKRVIFFEDAEMPLVLVFYQYGYQRKEKYSGSWIFLLLHIGKYTICMSDLMYTIK